MSTCFKRSIRRIWYRWTCTYPLTTNMYPERAVTLRQRRNGNENGRGFCVVARRYIEAGELIIECSGLTPIRDTVYRTDLSVVGRRNGAKRVLAGPIRFLNHDCVDSNCIVRFQFNVHTIGILIIYQYRQISSNGYVVETIKPIAVGGELLAYYNADYFEGPCPCRSHTSIGQAELPESAKHDESVRLSAKKANRLRKKECMKARIATGTLTQAEKEKRTRNNMAKKKRAREQT